MTNDELVDKIISLQEKHAKDLKDFAEKFAWLSTQLLLNKQVEDLTEPVIPQSQLEDEIDAAISGGMLDNVG